MRRKKHHAIVLLLVVTLLLSLLAACTGNNANKETATPAPSSSAPASSAPAQNGATEGTDEPKPPLKLTAVRPAVYPIKQDALPDTTLENLIQTGIANHTGGTPVEAEWFNAPTGQTDEQWLQTVVAANTVPEIVAFQDSYGNPKFMEIAAQNDLFHEITEELIRANMPNYVSRFETLGGSLTDALAEAKTYAPDGKLNFIPHSFRPNVWSNIPRSFAQEPTYYGFYLRDDIMKKIFPNARTAKELEQLLVEKGGLTVADITGDIPIRNRDELYDYLVKVKALNEKVGDKQVYPFALTNNSELIESIWWSITSINGYFWHWPMTLMEPYETSFYLPFSEKFGQYLKWVNRLYNDKLMDPEIFVMKNAQYHAKAVNGEYAVLNWTLPISQAIEIGKERGYGYRYVPVFYPADMSSLNNRAVFANYQGQSLFVSKKIGEENLPTVLRWIDYYLGQEYDDIRSWGSPDWYTGEGADRKFKPEYKAIENWALYGSFSEKDGFYYGMGTPIPMQISSQDVNAVKSNPVVNPVISFLQGYFSVPTAPYMVLPKTDGALLAQGNIFNYQINLMYRQTNQDQQIIRSIGWNEGMMGSLPEWKAWDDKWLPDNQRHLSDLTNMILGKPGDFDKRWAAYVKEAEDAGLREAEQAAGLFLKDKMTNFSEVIDKQ